MQIPVDHSANVAPRNPDDEVKPEIAFVIALPCLLETIDWLICLFEILVFDDETVEENVEQKYELHHQEYELQQIVAESSFGKI